MTTIDQIIVKYITENLNAGEWPWGNFLCCVIALVLSVVLCGAIGIERERRGRTAGLRTHLLVGVASCIVMIISIYGFPAGAYTNRDPARLAAQVIAGVGFLGAGAIVYRNSGTRGLTTAATIWITMAIGIACGSMNFILAIGGTGLILLVLTLFRKLENRINHKAPLIIMTAKPDTPIASRLMEVAEKSDCRVSELHIERAEDGTIEVTFLAAASGEKFEPLAFIAKLQEIEGVITADMLNSHKS